MDGDFETKSSMCQHHVDQQGRTRILGPGAPAAALATWPHRVTRRGSQSDHFSPRVWHAAAPGAMFELNQLLQ